MAGLFIRKRTYLQCTPPAVMDSSIIIESLVTHIVELTESETPQFWFEFMNYVHYRIE